MAVDAADDRFPETRHQQEEVDKSPAVLLRLRLACAWLEAAQVGARGESPIPGTCEDHDSHGVIVLAPPKGGHEIEKHPRREGIALLGAVQRDRGDVACRRQQHVL